MKPNFALNVTDDSLGLLHRTRQGWSVVGETRFDRDDLDEALGFLRATATELAPKGVTTKIVIPNSQILFMDVAAPGPDDKARRAQIVAALEGRTPYAVPDLVFDWSGEGAVVQVAVLARETLEQAEGFAVQHGFNPLGFVAIPPEGSFAGEPWFGPTAAAADILGKGKQVTRDTDAIQLVAGAAVPVAEVPVAEVPVAEVVVRDVVEPVVAPVVVVADPEPEPEPVVETVADVVPEPFQAEANFIETAIEVPAPVVDEAPFTHVADTGIADVPEAEVAIGGAGSQGNDDVPPAPSQAALIAFASRRAPDAGANGGASFSASPPAAPSSGVTMPGLVAERLAARAQALADQGAARPAQRIDAGAFVTAPSITGAGLPGGKKRKGATGAGPVAATAAPVNDLPARKPLTKPGGTFAATDAARGKPRYLGLILTGILLLFLALVAAWSSFFLASRGTDAAITDFAAADPVVDPSVDANAAPAIDDEMLADGQDPAALGTTADIAAAPVVAEPAAIETATAEPLPAAEDLAVAAADPAPEAVAPVAEPVIEAGPAPDTGVDATVPVAAVPDAPQDEIFLSAMDTPPPARDAATLQQPTASADSLPAAQMPPPPFGTVYQFDAAGLIVPTAEGIITPEGVRLVAGAPSRVPPARPATLITTVAAAVPVLPETAIQTFAADPALAAARPKLRPEGLVPAGLAPVGADDAALTTEIPIRSTSLIPRARPETILAAGEEARRATEAASLAASAATSQASEEVILALAEPAPNASPLAVSVSRVPAPRPRDLEKAVAAAVAAASAPAPAPEPEPEPQQATAPAAPEADAEPEVADAAPARPTGRTVAEQATFVNAIALNRINLIGVYGTQSNRYALIRQANGRYKKVSVGDRIDGGTIAAITDDQVRYQKGGRMIALDMPRG